MYANDTYRWFAGLTMVSLVLSFLLFHLIFLLSSKRVVRYICRLSDQIQGMEGGDLDQPIVVEGNNELTRLAQGLDSMRQSFKEQKDQEIRLLRANQVMITQMSHDFRTPLTALQIYTDILRYRKFERSEQCDEYLNKIDAKIAQIKQLSEHIFEYSLISGHQPVYLDPPRRIRDVFHDPLSELVAYLGQQGFVFTLELDWPEGRIRVYPQYIKRLMDNLVSNLTKYADRTRPVRIAISLQEEIVSLSVSNHVRREAVSQESSRIGLANMQTMLEKMGGALQVCRTPENFQVILCFPASTTGLGEREPS